MRVFFVMAVFLAACEGSVTSASGGDDDNMNGPDADPLAPDARPKPDAGPRPDATPRPDADPNSPDAGAPSIGQYFPNGAIWYDDYSNASVDPESDSAIAAIGDWATSGIFQIDFSIEVLDGPSGTPFRAFTKDPINFFAPDCDFVQMPLPVGGAVEGSDTYACGGGDCHLIVVDEVGKKLYEMWKANVTSSTTFVGGCLAVWDMQKVYGENGRGDGCTSADAAGYPIAPLLFSADEVAAGHIDHAIRFILPNAKIRKHVYFHPSTHTTNPTNSTAGPPYGAHLRLKASFDISGFSPEAQVVLVALKKYGMFLGDGGNVPLTAQGDRFTVHKWDGLLGPHDLDGVHPGDFEMLTLGAGPFPISDDCVRLP